MSNCPGITEDPNGVQGRLKLASRALRLGWAIPAAHRAELMADWYDIARDVTRPDKARLEAGRLILLADGLNMREAEARLKFLLARMAQGDSLEAARTAIDNLPVPDENSDSHKLSEDSQLNENP